MKWLLLAVPPIPGPFPPIGGKGRGAEEMGSGSSGEQSPLAPRRGGKGSGVRGLPLFRCVALALPLFGCATVSVIPSPPTGPHLGEEPALVPYPPPAARVEVVGAAPSTMKDPVWIDGEWLWKARRWVWQGGHWDLPLPGGYYAVPVTVRLSDGALAHYAGTWKDGTKKE